jgi:hypothetical protein
MYLYPNDFLRIVLTGSFCKGMTVHWSTGILLRVECFARLKQSLTVLVAVVVCCDLCALYDVFNPIKFQATHVCRVTTQSCAMFLRVCAPLRHTYRRPYQSELVFYIYKRNIRVHGSSLHYTCVDIQRWCSTVHVSSTVPPPLRLMHHASCHTCYSEYKYRHQVPIQQNTSINEANLAPCSLHPLSTQSTPYSCR